MPFRMGKHKKMKRLLVIVAMDVEEKAVIQALGHFEEKSISKTMALKAKVFNKNGKEIVLINSGIGQVNAGVTTALVAHRMKIDGVLLFGVAGAVKPGLEIGDVIVASKVIQHDSVFSGDTGKELMAPGAPFVSIEADKRQSPAFEVDSELRDWLREALPRDSKIRFSEGTLVSGSEFVGSSVRKNEIANISPDALAVEMEASGVAVVAKKLGIPFGAIKTVADRLNPDESVSNDYNKFINKASENAGHIMNFIWKEWTRER